MSNKSANKTMLYSLKAGALCARIVPRKVGIKLSYALGYVYGSFPTATHKRISSIHEHISPQLTKREKRKRASAVLASYASYWWDVFWLSSKRSSSDIDSIVSIDGHAYLLDAIENAKEGGPGIILALPHLGSWEIAGAWLGTFGHEPVVVAERLKPPELFELFTSTRTRVGMKVIAHDDHPTSKLLAALKDGRIVCLVADRDISRKGIPVHFFGSNKTMPTGPAALAHKTGAVIVPVCTYVTHDCRVNITFYPPIDLRSHGDDEDRNAVIEKTTQRLAFIFEDMISRDPEQWHVLYDEWEKP